VSGSSCLLLVALQYRWRIEELQDELLLFSRQELTCSNFLCSRTARPGLARDEFGWLPRSSATETSRVATRSMKPSIGVMSVTGVYF
jgi:hypothetical protein